MNKTKKIINMICIILLLIYALTLAIEVRVQKEENQRLEQQFQIYRSAAEDAYGFAIGSESDFGEKIPLEFFLRYVNPKINTTEASGRKKERANVEEN